MKVLMFLIVALLTPSGPVFSEGPQNSKRVALALFSGDFIGEKSSGLIEHWVIYSDGTVEGKWTNLKDAVSTKVAGTYAMNSGHFVFMVSGTQLLPNKQKSNVEISGSGSYSPSRCSGVFTIFRGNRKLGNDFGKFAGIPYRCRTEPKQIASRDE